MGYFALSDTWQMMWIVLPAASLGTNTTGEGNGRWRHLLDVLCSLVPVPRSWLSREGVEPEQ
jgi:hypothetical protein